MDCWDVDYINLVVPGYIRIDRDGHGFMQFGAVEADLDCRVEDAADIERLEFTFQGFDEGDPISGRGWAAFLSACHGHSQRNTKPDLCIPDGTQGKQTT